MKMTPDRKIILIIAMFFVLVQCKRDWDWKEKEIEIGNIVYYGETIILGNEELSLLKESPANNRLIFTGLTDKLSKLVEGTTLVLGVSEMTPFGALYKVESFQQNGSELLVNTSSAILTDVVKRGKISFKQTLLEKNFSLKSKLDGIIAKGHGKSFEGLSIAIDNFEIFGSGSSTAKINGSIGIYPEIEIEISVVFNESTQKSEIESVSAIATLTKIDEITLNTNGNLNAQREVITAEFVHAPVVADSIVFTPLINLKVGINGTTGSAVEAGIRQDRTIRSSLKYENMTWTDGEVSNSVAYDFYEPSVTENSNIKVLSGPEIQILIFGKPIQVINSPGYYTLDAVKSRTPIWKLFSGSEGNNIIKKELLGFSEDHSLSIEIQSTEISR